MADKKWTDYTTKTTPANNDEVMELSTDERAHKRLTLGNLSDWILNKIADRVYSKLETSDKTIIGALNELNSKALIDTSEIFYSDAEVTSLGGVDACVKDAVDKNKFPAHGIFFKAFTSNVRYLAIGYRYVNGAYGTIILYNYAANNDKRYSISKGVFSKI